MSTNSLTDRTPDPEGPEGPEEVEEAEVNGPDSSERAEQHASLDLQPMRSPKSPVRDSIVKVGTKTTAAMGKATKSTTNAVVKTSKTIAHATGDATKQIGSAIKHSEEVYEKSPWCSGVRWIPKHFPRFISFFFGVLLPLWILILISAGFGILLADYEAPAELESNHDILASRARLNKTFVKRTDLGKVPVDCILNYMNQANRSIFEERIKSDILSSSTLDTLEGLNLTNVTDMNATTTVNETDATEGTGAFDFSFANATNNASDTIASNIINLIVETEDEILLYMTQCQKEQNDEIQAYLEVRDAHGDTGADSLSFNWIRCWPEKIDTIWGDTQFVFFPSRSLIQASHPNQQEAFVESEFARILEEEEATCLESGEDSNEECFEQAIEAASAGTGDVCHANVEGTSWFFFTIMTTVGYGNQAPITEEGRLVIYIGGIAALILFASVLGSSGYIILAIFDDTVERFYLSRFLSIPIVGVVMWGGIWIAWAYGIATDADNWWAERLPDFEVDRDDALWFAFISTSTIGLGDYSLHPAVMFGSDALWFSAEFLIGFVFLSTFLNKIGEFLFSMLPKRKNSLETRLKETNLFFWKHWPCTDYLRSYMLEVESEATSQASEQQQQQPDMQQQVQRVEELKSHLPNQSIPPQLITMEDENKTMDSLLEEEEMILKALLESAEQRRSELRNAAAEESSPVVTQPVMPDLDNSTEMESSPTTDTKTDANAVECMSA
ncbi:unnamed protein product [Cylindrotheca closterium]|uniref:Potassium channel domain-containing protein n=1 Tax=Cylindrotheca closterium TaxID=2856 RepID=A0AAD2FVB8_9STRA|nr:unnamed protein product [Cylindrotheca closterium]